MFNYNNIQGAGGVVYSLRAFLIVFTFRFDSIHPMRITRDLRTIFTCFSSSASLPFFPLLSYFCRSFSFSPADTHSHTHTRTFSLSRSLLHFSRAHLVLGIKFHANFVAENQSEIEELDHANERQWPKFGILDGWRKLWRRGLVCDFLRTIFVACHALRFRPFPFSIVLARHFVLSFLRTHRSSLFTKRQLNATPRVSCRSFS